MGTMSNKVLKSTIFILYIGLFGSMVYAGQLEKKITWYIFDIKPTHFIDGPDKGKGFADFVQSRLIERMTDYQHVVQVVSVARLVADLKAKKHLCTINGFYGGSPFPTAYAAPFNISRARKIAFIRKKRSKILSDGPTISFESLIRNPNLVFGHMAGEPYHPKLMNLLAKYQTPKNVFIRYDSTRISAGLFEMLLKERVDYILTSINVLKYHRETMKGGENLEGVFPDETASFVELVAPNCTGNAWGEMVVKDINKVLIEIRPTEAFRKNLEKWYAEPGRDSVYRDLYEKEVLSRNQYRPDLELK